MTDLAKKLCNGIVSDIPVAPVKTVTIPVDNVIDIPEFMKRRRMELSEEYARRQAELYALSRQTRWQKIRKRLWSLFFIE